MHFCFYWNPYLQSVAFCFPSLMSSEPPRVSLNVGSTLSLVEGDEQKVVCEAESYYPLDVEIQWYEQDPGVSGQRVGAPLPRVLQNVLLSSHKHNQDKTFSLAAFFYLDASLKASGKQYTCSVSHTSLRMPIRKSFILEVEGKRRLSFLCNAMWDATWWQQRSYLSSPFAAQEPASWMFNLTVGVFVFALLAILAVMLSHLNSGKQGGS